MVKFSTPQISKTISNANGTHEDYQRILGPYPCNAPLGFRWFPNGWKLKPIESTPTNVSFEQLFFGQSQTYTGKTVKESNET